MSEKRTLPEIGSEFTLLVNDREYTFKHFMLKEMNSVKIDLPDEGIWACLSDEDMRDYRQDKLDDKDVVRVAVLRNSSINGFPWGTCIPVRLMGGQRPEHCLDELDDQQDLILNQHDTQKATDEEKAEAKAAEEAAEERRNAKPKIAQRHFEAMVSMGYRKMAPDTPLKWAKPIGGQLLTIELDRREMTLWFEAANDGSPQRWDTQELFLRQRDCEYSGLDELNGIVAEIKSAEANLIRCWRGRVAETQFHFLTRLEAVRLAVGDD